MENDLENDLFSKGSGFEVANPRDRWSFTMNRRITLILEVRGGGEPQEGVFSHCMHIP